MANNIGLYAKAIGGSLAAAGTAAITALSDGRITNLEWITIASSFLASLGAVWAVPNMPKGVAKYAKMIAGAIVAGLGALATAYVTGNVINESDLIHIGIAVLGSLGIVYVTPNAAASGVFLPTVNAQPVIAGPAPDSAASYNEHPDSEDYDPDYVPGVGYDDPIPEGTVSGPAAKESSKSRKLGRLAPTGAPRVKLTRDLLPQAEPTPPATVDWWSKVPEASWGMDGNDNVGDCTCAEVDHSTKARQVAAGNTEVKSSATEVLAAYSAITGYNPDDPSSDQGAVMQNVRDYWRKHGIILGGKLDQLTLFAAVDHTDLPLVKWCCSRFGAVALGINFPDSAMTQFDAGKPWDVVKGARIEGGHAISMVGYDDQYAYVVTWGRVQPMTWAFFQKYVDEAWTDVSTDWLNSVSGEDPLGEVAYALGEQFQQVTGQPNPFPAPQPSPTPAPSPVPTPPTPADVVPVSAGLATDVTGWANRCVERKSDSHEDKAVAREWLAEVGNA